MEVRLLNNNKLIIGMEDGSYYLSKFELDDCLRVVINNRKEKIGIGNISRSECLETKIFEKKWYEEITSIDALEYLMDTKSFAEGQLEKYEI